VVELMDIKLKLIQVLILPGQMNIILL